MALMTNTGATTMNIDTHSTRIPKVSNQEKQEIWQAYHEGTPIRVPVRLNTNYRVYLLNPALNTQGITFQDAYTNPLHMLSALLGHQEYCAMQLSHFQDSPHGFPEEFKVGVNWQNNFETAFLGAPILYYENQIPDTLPIFSKENKNALFDVPIDDPLSNPFIQKGFDFYHRMKVYAESNTYKNRPIRIQPFSRRVSDGPVTIAMNLYGSDFLSEMIVDPDVTKKALAYIMDAAINTIQALDEYWNISEEEAWFADDSIQLISNEMYEEQVLPLHKKYYDLFTPNKPRMIHLCGDVMRFMPLLQEKLNVQSWDSGFPVDFGRMRKTLGPEFEIAGGPPVMLLSRGTPKEVYAETVQILESGIKEGGRFILQEANNLPPNIPLANLEAMYQACLDKGWY